MDSVEEAMGKVEFGTEIQEEGLRPFTRVSVET